MSSYIIAGSANKPETGQCEHIANLIKSYYKNIDFRIIIKHPKEWENYIHEILRIYGFKKKFDPIIFTLDGKLIGGIDGFKELAQKGFGIDANLSETNITPEINMKIVEKEVASKKKIQKGKKTLEEKIALSMKEKLQEGHIKAIEGYYTPHINNGLLFYTKYEKHLSPEIEIPREQRCEIVKEVIQQENLDIAQIAENDYFVQQETQPDEEVNLSVQEQKTTGRQLTSRLSKDSKEQLEQEPKKEQEQQGEEQPQQQQVNSQEDNNTVSGELQEGDKLQSQENVEQKSGQEIKLDNQGEGEAIEGEQQENTENQQQTLNQISNQDLIPAQEEEELEDVYQHVDKQNNYELVNLNKTLIKKIKKTDYCLAFHPNPLLDGQILLFENVQEQQQEQTQEDNDNNNNTEENDKQSEKEQEKQEDQFNIIDWSKGVKHRKLKKKYKKQQQQKSKVQIEDQQQNGEEEEKPKEKKIKYKSKLNKEIVELDKPLAKNDWKQIKKLMKKLDSVVTFQILPFGHNSHIPLSNSVINVYLREFLIRANKNEGLIEVLEDYNKNEQEIEVELLPFEKYIQDLQGQAGQSKTIDEDFIQIHNLEFDHIVYPIKDQKKIKAKHLKKRFKEMTKILYSDEDQLKYGISCIITRNFMMLVPLRGPYGKFDGKPLYLNALSYMGYIHLPIVQTIWPNTAYNVDTITDEKDYLKILNNAIDNAVQI